VGGLLNTLTTGGYIVVMSVPRSVRFDNQVLARLDRYVREHPGASSSAVTNMFVDEALRAHEHPGIVFRPGPTGRRAALAGGPDVWEVVSALAATRAERPELDGDALVGELATVTGLSREQVTAVLRYYAAYPEEIEDRVRANEEAAEREYALWTAEQRIIGHSG
jgi:acyl-CoA synthetase (NDP forming)